MQLRPLLPRLGSPLRHRSRSVVLLTALLAAAAAAAEPGAEVTVEVEGLRSQRGQVLACLTARPAAFPDCRDDPSARKLVVAAAQAAHLDFGHIPAGSYAIALLHDENGNGRADMALMIPREGFGFSRDAPVRFGPPSFARAAFAVGGAPVRQTITMRYIL